MKHFRLLSIVCVIICIVLLSGCSKKEDDSSDEPNTDTELSAQVPTEGIKESPKEGSTVQSSAEGTLVKDVLALWEAGQKDEAVRQFLTIQWDNPSVFQEMQVLIMPEQEFRSLSQDEMKRIVGEAMNLTGKLRELMFYVVSIGDKLASSGDIKLAKEHFEAVRLYGEVLSQSERLEVIRNHGKAAAAYAQKRLSGIE